MSLKRLLLIRLCAFIADDNKTQTENKSNIKKTKKNKKIKINHMLFSQNSVQIIFFLKKSDIHLLAKLPRVWSYFEWISVEKNIKVNMLPRIRVSCFPIKKVYDERMICLSAT